MNKRVLLILLIGTAVTLMACQLIPNVSLTGKGQTQTPAPENTLMPESVLPTVAPLATTVVTIPTAGPVLSAGPLPDYSQSVYLDDRSTPAAVMLSYANAINRHEYIRAYSYWIDPAAYLGSLDDFASTYANVDSMEVVLGPIGGDGAAGSIYYPMPMLFKNTTSSSTVDRYSACFLLRMAQPGNYGAPPITPMHIERGSTQVLPASTSDSDGLSNACTGSDFSSSGSPAAPASVEVLSDLSSANYIDNRSGAIEVVSSLFNAINHKEYVRAYSYWENPASTLGSYDAYAAGFSDTGTITATFGAVLSDAGAGQLHYSIPVAEVVQTTSAATQTFVGCYILHLANPGMQATPPFEPLGITQGHFTLVPNGTNTAPLLATACT